MLLINAPWDFSICRATQWHHLELPRSSGACTSQWPIPERHFGWEGCTERCKVGVWGYFGSKVLSVFSDDTRYQHLLEVFKVRCMKWWTSKRLWWCKFCVMLEGALQTLHWHSEVSVVHGEWTSWPLIKTWDYSVKFMIFTSFSVLDPYLF